MYCPSVYLYDTTFQWQLLSKSRFLFCIQFAMAEFPDLQPPQPFSGFPTDHQPISRTAQPAAEVLSAAPHCHHGEVLYV